MKRDRSMTIATRLCALFAVVLAATSALHAKPLDVVETWTGQSSNRDLRGQAPPSGAIVDDESWAKLWKAWQDDKPVPDVNFAEHLVIVATVYGPNRMTGKPQIEDDGNVRALFAHTLLDGPGFGFIMVQVPRQGIKTINGKPLPQAARSITVPAMNIEDNGGLIGTVFTFELSTDGQWAYTHFRPRNERKGQLTQSQADALVKLVESDTIADARDVKPDRNIADRDYFKLGATWNNNKISFDVPRSHEAASAFRAWVQEVIAPKNEVTGRFMIPADAATTEGMTLIVRLWEYDPLLADASAKEVGSFEKNELSHEQGEESAFSYTVRPSANDGQLKASMKYYVTAQIDHAGKRLFYGKPEQGGMAKVFEDGQSSEVTFTGQKVDG